MRIRFVVSLCLLGLLAGAATAEPDLVTQGQVLLANGEAEKALVIFKEALGANRKNLDAALGVVDCYLDMDRPDDAINASRDAVDIDDKKAGPWLRWAEAYSLKAQHLTAAQAPGSQIRLCFAEAKRRAEQALGIDPKLAGAHLVIGKAALGEYDSDTAIAEFRKEIALDPASAEAGWMLGNELFKKEDYAGAAEAFRVSTKGNPNDALVWRWLGVSLNRAGKRAEAGKAYLEAAKLLPKENSVLYDLYSASKDGADLTQVHENFRLLCESLEKDEMTKVAVQRTLAWYLKDDKKPKDALKVLDDVLKAHPQDALALAYKGGVLQDLGRPEEAITAYRKSLELNPNGPYPYDRLHVIALDELRRGDVTGAIELMEWLYEVKPTALVANNLGLTHRDSTHDYRKALDWYLKASKLAPRDVDILNDTGLIYQYHLKDPDKALEFYEKVLKIAREDHRGEIEMDQPPRGYGDALENMGLIYVERKQWDKAREVLDELLGYYPSRPVAKRLRAQIPD